MVERLYVAIFAENVHTQLIKLDRIQSHIFGLLHSTARCLIIVMPSIRLGSDKYQFLSHWFDSARVLTQHIQNEYDGDHPLLPTLLVSSSTVRGRVFARNCPITQHTTFICSRQYVFTADDIYPQQTTSIHNGQYVFTADDISPSSSGIIIYKLSALFHIYI